MGAPHAPHKPSPSLGKGEAPALPPYDCQTSFSHLYRLKVIKNQTMDSILISFRQKFTINEVIDQCKTYCAKNGLRFIFVELAVTDMGDCVDED